LEQENSEIVLRPLAYDWSQQAAARPCNRGEQKRGVLKPERIDILLAVI